MAVKYYISFTSELGKDCRVEFDIDGYSGNPIELYGGGCSILYDGSDMFDPIITSKASLSVNYHEQFILDTRDADDKEIPVTIYHGNEKWIGFLISDNRDETFDKTNQSIDLVCVDPFSFIRTLQKDIFRDIEMFGRRKVEDVIRGIFNYVLDSLVIDVQNDTLPNGISSGTMIDSTYCFTQVFMDDNGIFKNGYDIIESLMSDLVMTAMFYNGVLVLRNNKYLMGLDGVEVGLSDDFNFWIGNSELVTRTRGQKESSRSLDYPDPITLLTNPYFYYYDDTKTDKVRGWFERTSYPWEGVTGVEYIGTGRERSPYGYRISGLFTAGAGEGKDVGALWTIAAIQMPIGTLVPVGNMLNYLLKIKFRYSRYPIVLNDDGEQRKLQLAVTVVARDLGSTKKLFYNNNGKTGLGEYSIDQWDEFISTTNNDPRVYFPIDNTNEIQDIEISIPDVANYGMTGSIQYEVYLFPISDTNGNGSIISSGGGWSAYPSSVDYLSVDFMLVRDGEAYYNGNAYVDKYTNEQSFYTSQREFSQIGETKSMTIGRSYFLAGRDSEGNDINVLDAFNRASLTDSNGDIINVFNQGGVARPLIQMAASSELFFNRLPRYQIDAIVRGDVNITNIITSPKVIEGKYVCVKDEYDLYYDTHNMTLQQLKGSDDETDIIENFLSTN